MLEALPPAALAEERGGLVGELVDEKLVTELAAGGEVFRVECELMSLLKGWLLLRQLRRGAFRADALPARSPSGFSFW